MHATFRHIKKTVFLIKKGPEHTIIQSHKLIAVPNGVAILTATPLPVRIDFSMLLPRSSHSLYSLYYRCALALAWVAMCLLFTGPLLSQFQASHHHDHAASAEHHHKHHHPDQHQHHAADHHQSSGLLDWYNQCGYCELWQHSPSLSIVLPAIAHTAFLVPSGLFLALHIGALFQHNYPHALSRAPPSYLSLNK